LSTLYWSIAALLFGGCTGSFVNVIIYRWPRGISLLHPSRSFCPTCGRSIAWYDNVPVVSYVLLGGRCRQCRAPISLQYPLVELATALVFLITYDAFFVAHERLGITDLSSDWPILVAHWVLWAGMIALAVMDLEAYMVDINVTWAMLPVGLVAYGIWTPASSLTWIRPGPQQAAGAIAIVLGLIVGAILFLRRQEGGEDLVSGSDEQATADESSPPTQPEPKRGWSWLALAAAIVCVVAYVVLVVVGGEQRILAQPALPTDPNDLSRLAGSWAWNYGSTLLACGLAALFVGLTLAASRPSPEADVEIVEAIHAEAPRARRNALRELMFLLPAIILGIVVLCLFASSIGPHIEREARGVVEWRPVGQWCPILGLSTALSGWIIGGAIGWLVRIVFTLALGKEALGMGDVHILAAAGAVAGWPVVLIGFFLAAFLALLGIVVVHLRRQSRALPYGPWLALAFLVASIFQDRILIHLYPLTRWLWE
jgi:leader peptidase (prepilin peptidase) / N-methyltransferase